MNELDRRRAEDVSMDSDRMLRLWNELQQFAYSPHPSKSWIGETPLLTAIKFAKHAAREDEEPETLIYAIQRWCGQEAFHSLLRTIEFRSLYQLLAQIETTHAP